MMGRGIRKPANVNQLPMAMAPIVTPSVTFGVIHTYMETSRCVNVKASATARLYKALEHHWAHAQRCGYT
jgi:hypothetical protein